MRSLVPNKRVLGPVYASSEVSVVVVFSGKDSKCRLLIRDVEIVFRTFVVSISLKNELQAQAKNC